MKRILKLLTVALFIILAGAQFMRPERTNPTAPPEKSFAAHLNVPADVQATLKRACMDCHSNQTHWPWYSNVAPVSWFVADHVNEGRRDLNLSEWPAHDREEAEEILKSICREVKTGMMPLSSYVLLHPEAELSPADQRALCEWATQEGQRLASFSSHTMMR